MSPRIIARSRVFFVTSAWAAVCLLLAACGGSGGEGDHGNVAVTGVSLDRVKADMRVGTTLQLTLTVSPSNATNPSVGWSTSSPSVATVSTAGLVTAVAKGVATITVTAADGGKTATCEVTVSDGPSGNVAVTGVNLDRAAAELNAGAALQLTKTVSPSNATNPSVGWSTSSSSVATVSTTGLVTAVAKGVATITVTTSDGGKTATCEVTVTGTLTLVAGIVGSASTAGNLNGTGSAARFNGPEGVAVDSSGNIYVGDTKNYTLRKVTPGGEVTTIAGLAGARGSDDGTGMGALFNDPRGLAVDSTGNVYVADLYNEAIRKVTPDGKVTTFAGGHANPIFTNPSGVAVDGAGNVFVADRANHVIRKVTPDGTVSTLAGLVQKPGAADGTGTDARFYYPQSVAVDGSGNVYVGDSSNYTIRKVTPAGVVTTLAGSATQSGFVDATGSEARFSTPAGVAVDGSGNVYVADLNNLRIRKVTTGGKVTTVASGSLLLWPSAVAISPVSGHLFIAVNNAVLELAL